MSPIKPRNSTGESLGEPTGEPKQKPRHDLQSIMRQSVPPPDAEPAQAESEPVPALKESASKPAEPASAEQTTELVTAESEPPPIETPSTTPETPPAPLAETSTKESSHWYETPRRIMVDAAKRFMSKFRGEVQPQDEKEYKASLGDVTKNAATGFLSVVGSYTGVKILADLPQWLYQKYWTNPAERQRIKDALAAKEVELGETTEPTAIDQKKAKLEEAINASKFLTKEKKAKLLGRLHTTVDDYEKKDKTLRTERNEEIAKLLDQAIETRVKNTQVLKEGLNSALMITGLAAMRGVAYGAVASYERYKQVAKERTEGKRKGGQFNEWIVKGFTETAHNLIGGKADTWAGKGVNFVKGATNVLRAAGFADLAIAEWTGEGRSVSNIIETSLKAWEDKGVVTGWENIKAPWERLGHLGEYAKTAVTGSEPALGVTPETPDGSGAGGVPASPEAADATGSPQAAVAAGAAGAAGVAVAESAPSVEIPEAQIEAGLVKKGGGILKILERQGVEGKLALEAAREAGIVRADGNTWLTTKAIGRLSVFPETQPDGGIEIKFFDSETDKLLTLQEAREAGFTHEHGTVPGEIPTDEETVELPSSEPTPPAETTPAEASLPTPDIEVLTDSSAPNDLLGGTFHIYIDAEGHFTLLDTGDGDMRTRMNDAIQELTKTGHGNSPEAKFIFEQYNLLASEGVEPAEVQTHVAAEPEVPLDDKPLRRFKGEAGRVKFIYDKVTGAVKDAFMPAYTPRSRDIEDSLKEWGLTTLEVKDHFIKEHGGTWSGNSHPGRFPSGDRGGSLITSAQNDYRQFVRDAERLSRQESLLNDMDERGYARTPEYTRLKMETERLVKSVTDNMTKQFKIKERGI